MSGIDEKLREELGALLDGALPEERAAELRRRLEEDAALRAEYETLERTVAAVRGLPRASAPSALRERLAESIAQDRRAQMRSTGPLLRWLAAAAVLVVGASVAFWAVTDRGRGATPEATEAKRERLEKKDERAGDIRDGAEEPRVAEGEAETAKDAGDRKEMDADATADKTEKAEAAKKGVLREEARDRMGKAAPAGRRAAPNDLVRKVEIERKLSDRAAYLSQLTTMSAKDVQSHVYTLATVPEAGKSGTWAQQLPSTFTFRAADQAQARQVAMVLSGWAAMKPPPAPAAEAKAKRAQFTGVRAEDTRLTTTIRATPQQMQRIASWLQFVSVPQPAVGGGKPAAGSGGGGAGGAAKKSARGSRGGEKREALQRTYRIVVEYPKPPEADDGR